MTAPESEKNLVLAGFMGTGKSCVGRLLAERMGREFVDMDTWIEQRAGKSIPEIFRDDGEPAFRRLEREVAADLSQPRSLVIATGGGAVLDAENVDALQRGGVLICLTAEPETVLARVRSGRHRPLLEGADLDQTIRARLSERAAAYAALPHKVWTDGRSPKAVAKAVQARFRAAVAVDNQRGLAF